MQAVLALAEIHPLQKADAHADGFIRADIGQPGFKLIRFLLIQQRGDHAIGPGLLVLPAGLGLFLDLAFDQPVADLHL